MIDPAQIRADHEKAMRSAPDEYSPEIVLTLLDAYERLLAAVTPSPAGLAGERLREAGLYLLRVLDCRAEPDEVYLATTTDSTIFSIADARAVLTENGSQPDRVVDVLREAEALNEIDLMMSEFVDNWPKPKRFDTALKLVAKTLRILMHPPKHQWWGAGETDCPDDIKAGNGEIHTLRCKVCGETSPRDSRCLTTLDAKDKSNARSE